MVRTPALEIFNAALIDAAERKAPRSILTMPPQEGKSWLISRWFPHWLLQRQPESKIGIVSYAASLARTSSQSVRNDIRSHPEWGLELAPDNGAASLWTLDGHRGGVMSAGIEGGLTGRPLDCLIIDDPLEGEAQALSEVYRKSNWNWWKTTGSARLSPQAIVIVVMTRWHEDDLVGRLRIDDPDGWRYINIPAQCDSDDDILDRLHGEYMISATGRTRAEWDQRKKDQGSRGWQALSQGDPTSPAGTIFKREWWVTSPIKHVLVHANGRKQAIGVDTVIISVDAAFKDTKDSDYVVMQVWGKRGAKAFLLDEVRDRMDFPTTCSTLVALCATWPQAHIKIIEDKANGPAIISTLKAKVPGLIPFTPVDSKEARAHAVAPFCEAGNVELPDPKDAPFVLAFIEELAGFPNAAHDDRVDACTQALHRFFIAGSRLSDFVDQAKRLRQGRG